MNETYEKYLESIDKHLRPLPISERLDIVKEIKGSILEMEGEGLFSQQIFERLGNPKDLAKAYLGDLLAQERGFSWTHFLTACAFYSLAGLSGVIVIPTLAITSFTFILCGVLIPIIAGIKLVGSYLNLNLGILETFSINFGNIIITSPWPAFIISLLIGVLLVAIAHYCWKLLLLYCKKISTTKSYLSV